MQNLTTGNHELQLNDCWVEVITINNKDNANLMGNIADIYIMYHN